MTEQRHAEVAWVCRQCRSGGVGPCTMVVEYTGGSTTGLVTYVQPAMCSTCTHPVQWVFGSEALAAFRFAGTAAIFDLLGARGS